MNDVERRLHATQLGARVRPAGAGGWLARALAAIAAPRVFAGLAAWRVGRLTVHLPDGTVRRFGDGDGPAATVRIHSAALFSKLAFRGDLGAGESYMDGDWSADDLPRFVELVLRNAGAVALDPPWSRLLNVPADWAHRLRRNTRQGSRRNIGAHYDLSNELFATFLDETMTYSSACFTAPGQSLSEAQREKYRRMARLAGVGPGDRVLEIGCGWGGFAEVAAGELGAHVTGITVSREQHAHALERIARAGLTSRVDLRLCDYRDLTGRYDRIVSIEMLEAVGREYWDAFFASCDRVLAPGGALAVQVITMPDHRFARYAAHADWIQTHIFPGGLLPSIGELLRSAARTSALTLRQAGDIAPDYARTLAHWRAAFLASLDQVRRLGFDDRFVRMWDYYLATCQAAFTTRTLGTMQLVFGRGGEEPRVSRC